MRTLEGREAQEAQRWFAKAAEVASRSLCRRALCGSIIVKDGELLAEGFNSPPQHKDEYRTCLNEYDIPAGFRHDRTCCIHAEQRAIENAMRLGKDVAGSRIYFVAVDAEGNKISATDIKCTICSRAVLDAGIAEFAFNTAAGVRVYEPAEVDVLSYGYKTPLRVDAAEEHHDSAS
jgi:deoxycytidylate deaminase